jgi:hypothetical protein
MRPLLTATLEPGRISHRAPLRIREKLARKKRSAGRRTDRAKPFSKFVLLPTADERAAMPAAAGLGHGRAGDVEQAGHG